MLNAANVQENNLWESIKPAAPVVAGVAGGMALKRFFDSDTGTRNSRGFFNFLNGISLSLFSKVEEKTTVKDSTQIAVIAGIAIGYAAYRYFNAPSASKKPGSESTVINTTTPFSDNRDITAQGDNVGGDKVGRDKITTTHHYHGDSHGPK